MLIFLLFFDLGLWSLEIFLILKVFCIMVGGEVFKFE